MAQFVAVLKDGYVKPNLEAGGGEELTTEQVLAYATLRQAWALEEIGNRLAGIDDALGRIAEAITN